uniref:Ubiquitin fusion degradation protein 1 homolog n=1 Tax=Trichuris muris TaxID=70415 RepID=A0A5S6QF80_TRIMR
MLSDLARFHHSPPPPPFDTDFRCYSVALYGSLHSNDRLQDINFGGKILLPQSALDWLTNLNVTYPMMFKITNLDPSSDSRFTHCGVLEFHQVEGLCYLPHWLMNNLLLCEGGLINVKLVQLPIGSYVKLKPENCLLSRLSDPSAVLELKLRNFSCLTKGDMFAIEHNGSVLEFLVQELRPADAVCIIDCDLSVEFDTPFEENTEALKHETSKVIRINKELPDEATKEEMDLAFRFPGVGRRLDGKDAVEQSGSAPGCSTSMGSSYKAQQTGLARNGHQGKRYPCDEYPGYYVPDWNYDENILTFHPPSWFKEGEMDARGRPLKDREPLVGNSSANPEIKEREQQHSDQLQ